MSPPSPTHLALVGSGLIRRVESANLLALSNITGANYYTTQSGGGEAGVATGFGAVFGIIPRKLGTSVRFLLNRANGAISAGWAPYFDSGNTLWFSIGNGAQISAPTYPLTALDLNRVLVGIAWFDGTRARLAVNRMQRGDGTAMTGYTPFASAMTMSGVSNGPAGAPAIDLDQLFWATFRGAPTATQLEALFDAIRNGGDIPTSFAAAPLTHRHSLRDALAGQTVTDGQLAPATLADTVTGAAADAMTRTGSPTVRRIDSSIDGRKSYGFFGVSRATYLQTTGAAGIAGSTANGLHVRMLWRPESLSTTRVLVGRGIIGGQGWWIQISGAGLTGVAGNGATATYTIQASELNQWHVVEMVLSGSTVRLYWDGVKVGADASAAFAPYAGPMIWGWCNHTGTEPGSMETFGALGGGDYGVTDAEVLAAYQETMRTGRLAATAGKTQHLYDVSLDIASTPDEVPAQILDRVGTDHLARVGHAVITASNFIQPAGAQTIRNPTATPALTGSTAGLWAEGLFNLASADFAGASVLMGVGSYGTNGWSLLTWGSAANPALMLYMMDGATGKSAIASVAMGLRHIAVRLSGTTADLLVDGAVVATVTVTAFTPSVTVPFAIGENGNGGYPLTKGSSWGGSSGAVGGTMPTNAELLAASNTARGTGRVVGVPSKTTWRWSAVDDVIAAGGALPPVITERVSGAVPLLVTESKLQVSRRTERLWSYETTPVYRGARGWSATNYLQAPNGTGLLTQALPYWWMIAIVIHAKAGGAIQTILNKSRVDGQQGVNVYGNLTWGQIQWTHGLGASLAALTYTVPDADIGRVLTFAGQWTGYVIQGFAKRARYGSDVAAAAFTPWTGAMRLGRHTDSASYPASDNLTILGTMGGLGNLALGEYQFAHDAVVSEERLIAVPGKTARLWNLGASGAIASVTDEQGSGDVLALAGTPTFSPIYHRAIAA